MPRANKGLQVKYHKQRGWWGYGEYVQRNFKWRGQGYHSRADAERAHAEVIIARGNQSGKCDPSRRLIGDVLAAYQLEHGPHTARPDSLTFFVSRIAPFFGDMMVSEINKASCMRYITHRQEAYLKRQIVEKRKVIRNLSNSSVRRELETLKAALRHDYEAGRLTAIPAVWMPNPAPSRSRWLTKAEAAALLRAARAMPTARDYLPLFIILALYTGARKDAILSLRWTQVDLRAGLIDFRPGQVSDNKGRSAVPIPRRLLRELKVARKTGTDLGYVVHSRGERLGDIKKGFALACMKAGLEGVTPHTLRHTASSWLVQKGVPIFEVARYLGHSSSLMIERTYGHLAPEHLKRAAASYG